MRVAILHLGRAAGMGERRRLWSWTAAAEEAGATVVSMPLLAGQRSRVPTPSGVRQVAAGRAVPEALAWSPAAVRRRLDEERATAVVCLTGRAHRPDVAPAGSIVVLDFVDRLSASYRDRAALAPSPLHRLGFRALAAAHRRFEHRPRDHGVRHVAAGRTDAALLAAEWFPNLVEVPAETRDEERAGPFDVLFFGNLSYAPNVAAVRRLAAVWPALQRRRPATTGVLAGANPSAGVTALAADAGWTVIADFAHLEDVARQSRLAVAPLVHTAGIQNKVLEAAALGMAQVITPEAAAGLDQRFPVTVANDDAALVESVAALLDDAGERRRQGDAGRTHVTESYSPAAWAPTVRRLLS